MINRVFEYCIFIINLRYYLLIILSTNYIQAILKILKYTIIVGFKGYENNYYSDEDYLYRETHNFNKVYYN